MKIAQMLNKLLNPALWVGDVNNRFSRSNYDKRCLPPLYFTQDYSVKKPNIISQRRRIYALYVQLSAND